MARLEAIAIKTPSRCWMPPGRFTDELSRQNIAFEELANQKDAAFMQNRFEIPRILFQGL
jgi:hypothetical protein